MISILYVDDEPGLLELCRIFLEQTGEFRVETVESAQEGACQAPSGTHYDAVISDYQMPEMDGISLLKSIRRACRRHPVHPLYRQGPRGSGYRGREQRG